MQLTDYSDFFENIEKPIAFIFGNDNVSILGVIRNLGKADVPCVVLNSKKKRQIFSFSRYGENIVCPDSTTDEKKFIDFLLNIGKKLKTKGVIFPTSDIDVHILLKHRDILEKYFIFPMAELNVVNMLLDKHNFYTLLEQFGIPHPKTYFPKNIDELHQIFEKISYPCIVKPAFSGYFRRDFQGKFFIAKNREEIIQYYKKVVEKNHKLIIQEIIPGESNNQYGLNAYYNQNYKPHGLFIYNKIRELPIFGGIGCYLQNVEIPELERITTSLIKKIKYYGIVDVEFRKDPRDGLFKCIEINPRIWFQNSFPTYFGMNIPYIVYMNVIGKNVDGVKPSKDIVKWFHLYEDIFSAFKYLKTGTMTLNEWIKSYSGKKMHAIFTWDDPLPAFVSFINFIFIELPYFLIRKLKRNHIKLAWNSDFSENIDKPIAFVFGNDNIAILEAVRNLGKVNIPTVVLTPRRSRQLFSFSKYCTYIICPDLKIDEKKYIDFLINLGKKLTTKGVLFPTSDIDLHVLLKHRDFLEKYFIFPMAELNIVDKLLDKDKFYTLLEEYNIPHAKTYFPNNNDELLKISEKISLPCIIKPAYSGYFRRDFETKFFVAKTKDEIIRYYDIVSKKNHKLVIQEIIPGDAKQMYGFNTYYDQNYNLHGIFMYNRIREWPIFAGNGCYLQSVEVPELEKITTSLIKKINYYGIVDAEFKKDPRDDLFKLIEINPRIWLQNSFPTRCGINIQYIAYMTALEKKLEEINVSKIGVKWLNLCEDIFSAIQNLKRRSLSFHDWIRSYKGENEYAIFDRNDPLPAFIKFMNYSLIECPQLLIRKLKRCFLMKLKK